jgi:hypothetical protein
VLFFAATTTTIFNPHRGIPFPAARFIIVAVPVILGFCFWFFALRKRK